MSLSLGKLNAGCLCDNIYISASTTIKIFNIDVTSECFGKKILEQNTEYLLDGKNVITKDSKFLIAVTKAQQDFALRAKRAELINVF